MRQEHQLSVGRPILEGALQPTSVVSYVVVRHPREIDGSARVADAHPLVVEHPDPEPADLLQPFIDACVVFMIAGDKVDALAMIIPTENSYRVGRQLAEKLKEIIPRQMFDVKIQAAIGGKIVASESISAMRKNVLAKCYGGDISRKRKLLEKQKEGKKKMKQIGNVEIPQEAFMAILKIGEGDK